MHPSRQISRGLLLRAKAAPLQAWRHQFSLRDRRPAFFNPAAAGLGNPFCRRASSTTFSFKLLICADYDNVIDNSTGFPLKSCASMKIATAPVNWNNADAPDFREWFPYPQILDLMVAAGYQATEWGMNMPSHVSQMLTDLNERQLQLLGGFVALELRNEAKLASEIERAIEFGHFFKSLGGQLLIAADSGDPFRLAQSGRVDPTSGLKKHEWHNLTSGLDQIGNQLRLEGVKVVFHNHVGTYVETEAETARLLEETNPPFDATSIDWFEPGLLLERTAVL
jgi:hypothetical protein